MIYLAWRYGNEDPWRLYNQLDDNYVPLQRADDVDHDPEAEKPVMPIHPSRRKAFMYACGKVAGIQEGKLKVTN